MLDPVGPRPWLNEPSEAEVAARLFWIYIFAEYGWFFTASVCEKYLQRAQAWEHWLRTRRAVRL